MRLRTAEACPETTGFRRLEAGDGLGPLGGSLLAVEVAVDRVVRQACSEPVGPAHALFRGTMSAMAGRRSSALNLANSFTMLRVALVPAFAWLVLWRQPPLPGVAAGVYAVAAATDTLDGWVARRLRQVTSFGEFLDPTADKLLVLTALAALALDLRVPWWAFWVVAAREAAIQALRTGLARRGRSLPAAPLGKAKTVSQHVLVVLAAATAPGSAAVAWALAVAIALTVVAGMQYVVDAARGRAGVPWR